MDKKKELLDIKLWAKEKIAGGQEPPWAWYQYMKLIETIDAILDSSKCVTKESSQQSEERQGGHLRLVDSTYPQDNAQPHSSGFPITLPM